MNRNDTMTRGAQTDQLRDEISLFITENFLYMRPDHVLRPDDDLLRLALFDSLGFIELIEEIQDRTASRSGTSRSTRRTSDR